jgi:hypothetical protein
MKTYKTVDQYEKEAKQNDRIVLAGYGIMDGLRSVSNKYDTFKVTKVDNKGLQIKRYKSKTPLRIEADSKDQNVFVLTSKEFNSLNQ